MARYVLISAMTFCLFTCTGPAVRNSGARGKEAEIMNIIPEGVDARITINENNQFEVSGRQIWFNGVNTPWNKWNDFGGAGWAAYDDAWWNNEFARLRRAGINSVRVWLSCNNGNGAIIIDDNGMISGASEKHWADLDLFFAAAERNQLYIMATLLSFDHFKNAPSQGVSRAAEADRWRAMMYSDAAAASFAQNYTIPFVKRYGGNPWLWSIDLCNEPDWIYEQEQCGKIPWERISYFFAVQSAAIHENSKTLVTVGISMPKYVSNSLREGNKLSDAFFQKLYPNENAYVDFWSTPHYYDWKGPIWGVPFYMSPAQYKLDTSKPALMGECGAKGSKGETKGTENNTIITDYEQAYLNGWHGVMSWTSNGVDGNGNLDDLKSGTLYMLEKYRKLIYPWE
ncbi:MAG: hypothetical protein LBH43_03010 [Treponema sp.]|nr:hypothetical protein [Treponema sp.]